jgi:hypothetical protein
MKPVITYFMYPFLISCSEPSGSELRLESWASSFVLLNISLIPVENSNESCYVNVRTVNFPWFPPYSLPVLHVIEWSAEVDV